MREDMRCRRAFDIDLPGFLAGERSPALEAFRAHYAGCRACAAEVRAWQEVHLRLGAGGEAGAEHPTPADLLAYEGEDPALGVRRAAVERHLVGCLGCGDELRALRAAASPQPRSAPEFPRRADAATASRHAARLVARVRAVTLHPAFAYAIVLLLLYPAARGVIEMQGREAVGGAAPQAAAPAPAAPGTAPAGAGAPSQGKAEAPGPAPEPRGRDARTAPGERHAPRADRTAGNGAGMRAPEGPPAEGLRAADPGPLPETLRSVAPRAAPQERPARQQSTANVEAGAASAAASALRVPVPSALRDAARLDVRVLHPDGRREIRQRIDGPAAEVAVALPADWVAVAYRVELSGAVGAETRRAEVVVPVR
jgi:hypothetical protein